MRLKGPKFAIQSKRLVAVMLSGCKAAEVISRQVGSLLSGPSSFGGTREYVMHGDGSRQVTDSPGWSWSASESCRISGASHLPLGLMLALLKAETSPRTRARPSHCVNHMLQV